MRHWWRAAAFAAVLAAAAPLLAVLIVRHEIDFGLVRARVIEEAQIATGRQIAASNVRIGLFPDLTVTADDIALGNPPGFAQAAMLTARHLRLQIALIPLLHHQVVLREVALSDARLDLEQHPGGPANWDFSAERPGPVLPGALAAAHAPRMAMRSMTVLAVDVDRFAVRWDTALARGAAMIGHGQLREVNPSSTIALALHATMADGVGVTLSGRFGGQLHLWQPADRSSWPVDVTLATASGTLTVTGTFTDPRHLAGYDLAARAKGPALWRLLRGWPDLSAFPHLADAAIETRLISRDGRLDVPRLVMTAGPSDLAALAPGLSLTRLVVRAPNIDGITGAEPNLVLAEGRFAGQPLALHARIGPVGRWFTPAARGARYPAAIDLSLQAAGATLTVQGQIQPVSDRVGTDAGFALTLPSLAAFDPLAGRRLPDPGPIRAVGRVTGGGGVLSLTQGMITLPMGAIGVDGTWRGGVVPNLALDLAITRLDLDALANALDASGGTLGLVRAQLRDAAAAILAGRIGGSLSVTAGQIDWHGVALTAIAALARAAPGQISLDPVAVSLGKPGPAGDGALRLRIAYRDAMAPAALRLSLGGSGVDAGLAARLAGLADAAGGRISVALTLAGQGISEAALTESLTGQVGLALTRGALRRDWLAALTSRLTPLGALHPFAGSGAARLACLAGTATIRGGQARLQDLLLVAQPLRLAAEGHVDLAAGRLDLAVRPVVPVGQIGIAVPSHASGTRDAPDFSAPSGSDPDPVLARADEGDCDAALAGVLALPVDTAPWPQPVPTVPQPSLLRRLLEPDRS